jgi:hypothetical protein
VKAAINIGAALNIQAKKEKGDESLRETDNVADD